MFFKRKKSKTKKLKWPDEKDVNHLPLKNIRTIVKVVDVYDGDTFTVLIPFGGEFLKLKIRLLGIDTPELNPRGKGTTETITEKEAAKVVRDNVKELILGKQMNVKLTKWDKYGGRVNGELYISGDYTLSDHLYIKGYAKKYNGGKKEEWTIDELKSIIQAANK